MPFHRSASDAVTPVPPVWAPTAVQAFAAVHDAKNLLGVACRAGHGLMSIVLFPRSASGWMCGQRRCSSRRVQESAAAQDTPKRSLKIAPAGTGVLDPPAGAGPASGGDGAGSASCAHRDANPRPVQSAASMPL